MIDKSRLWIVIPAHNEATRIQQVIRDIKKFAKNIIVVDDGSKDSTADVAKNAGAVVADLSVNRGKGYALRTGCEEAIKKGAHHLIFVDGDGQHAATDIPKLVEKLDEGNEIVFGSRNLKKLPFLPKIGNHFLTIMSNVLFKVKVKDSQSGYRAMSTEAFRKIQWHADDYFAETEMIIQASKQNLKYAEIEIMTIYPKKIKGTTWKDLVSVSYRILKMKFRGF